MIDQRTTYFGFALPHPSNALNVDVVRLQSALSGIDNMLNWAAQLLNSDDAALKSMQSIANAVRAIQTQLDLVSIASETTFAYDNQERVSSMSEVLPEQKTRTTTYLYAQDGALATTTVAVGGRIYVTSYSYTNGRLTGMTTQEQS